MPVKRTFSINRCYGIFFLVLTIALGALFILQASDIYFSAAQARQDIRQQAASEGWDSLTTAVKLSQITTYSRPIVGQRLSGLLPYVCIWLAALAGSVIIALLHPLAAADQRDPNVMLREKVESDRARLPVAPKDGKESDLHFALAQQQHLRRQQQLLSVIWAVLAAVGLLFPLLYFANADHFPSAAINAEVVAAALYCLPFLLVVLAGSIVYVYMQHRLLKKESSALKAAIAAGIRVEKKGAKKKSPALLIVRICLLVIGMGLFLWGTQNGSMQEVFIKATKICTECIGLG